MKTTFQATLFSLILISFSDVHAQYSAEELQSMYIELLQKHQIESWIDEDGDVQFEYEDKFYFLGVDPADPEFFRLVMFNIWPIESAVEASGVLLALDYVNREHKVVKGYSIDDNVWIAVELFVASPSEASTVFLRSLEELEKAVVTFVSEI